MLWISKLSSAIQFLLCSFLLLVGTCAGAVEQAIDYDPSQPEWRAIPSASVMRVGDDPSWPTAEIDEHWQPITDDAIGDEHGIIWFRNRIVINRSPEQIGYKEINLSLHASYEIYWDGELIGRSGVVGESPQTEQPGPIYNAFLLSPQQYQNGEHDLALRASSQYRQDLPFQRSFWVADYSVNNRYAGYSSLLPTLFLPVFLVIGIFYLALYWTNRQTTSHLLFALSCFSLLSYGVCVEWPHMIGFSYDWNQRIDTFESCSLIAFTLLLPAFFVSRYRIGYRYYIGYLALFSGVLAHAIIAGTGRFLPMVALAFSLGAIALVYKRGNRAVLGELVSVAACLAAYIYWLGDTENMFVYLPLLIVALLISQAVQTQRQKRSLELARLTQSRLECELLRRSLQPHFLMNTLANLLEGVETDVERTAEFIADLGEEFRMLADLAERQVVPLEEELRLCRTHLAIMSFRMRSDLQLDCEGADRELAIPPAIVHTLIENALTHNDYAGKTVQFLLQVERQHATTTLRLHTPLGGQVQTDTATSAGTGIGLKYVRSRLEQSFPERWDLASHSTRTHWVTTISVRQIDKVSKVELESVYAAG